MRNFILIFVFLFAMTGSYASNFNYQFDKTELNKTDVLIRLSPEEVINMSVDELENLIIKTTSFYGNDCTVTVTVTGTITVAGQSLEVSVSVTDSCENAKKVANAVLEMVMSYFE